MQGSSLGMSRIELRHVAEQLNRPHIWTREFAAMLGLKSLQMLVQA